MQSVSAIMDKVKARITGFKTVRVTAVQTQEQLLKEIGSINPDNLPAALVVYDRFAMSEASTIRDLQITVVVVDRFRAAAEDKALSAFAAFDALLDLFPPSGTDLGGAFALPLDGAAASVDPAFVCLALGLQIRSGGN